MEALTVEFRPIAAEKLGSVERHIKFDWAAPEKHKDRLVRPEVGEVAYLVAWNGDLPVGTPCSNGTARRMSLWSLDYTVVPISTTSSSVLSIAAAKNIRA